MGEVAYLSLIFTQFLSIKHYSNERLCHHLLNFFGPLKLFQTPSSPRSISPWVELLWESWWGKKWYWLIFFCANTMKISLIMTWNPKILYHGIALGQCDHFITSEVQNLSKIGVASHEVGVAKASWWGSRPTNWIGSSVFIKLRYATSLMHKFCW